MNDPELKAMGAVYEALCGLEDGAKARVLEWATKRFSLAKPTAPRERGSGEHGGQDSSQKELGGFSSVAEVFGAASPETTADKALVVAAFLHESNGGKEIAAREVNSELKHLGHGVKNITHAVRPLIEGRPQLLIQTRKEGKTRQAQKKYRVTNEGLARVKAMLSGLNGRDAGS